MSDDDSLFKTIITEIFEFGWSTWFALVITVNFLNIGVEGLFSYSTYFRLDFWLVLFISNVLVALALIILVLILIIILIVVYYMIKYTINYIF